MTADGEWAYYAARSIQALRVFAEGSHSVPELAERLRIAPRTARRLVGQLDRDGIVEIHPDCVRRRYRLAQGGYELGGMLVVAALRELDSREAAQRALPAGLALRRYRRAHGITQERFAHLLGADYVDYGHIERGRREVAGEEVVAFASRLGVDVLDLLTLHRGSDVNGSER